MKDEGGGCHLEWNMKEVAAMDWSGSDTRLTLFVFNTEQQSTWRATFPGLQQPGVAWLQGYDCFTYQWMRVITATLNIYLRYGGL